MQVNIVALPARSGASAFFFNHSIMRLFGNFPTFFPTTAKNYNRLTLRARHTTAKHRTPPDSSPRTHLPTTHVAHLPTTMPVQKQFDAFLALPKASKPRRSSCKHQTYDIILQHNVHWIWFIAGFKIRMLTIPLTEYIQKSIPPTQKNISIEHEGRFMEHAGQNHARNEFRSCDKIVYLNPSITNDLRQKSDSMHAWINIRRITITN